MNATQIRSVFEGHGIEPQIICIAPHKEEKGVDKAKEILSQYNDEITFERGDDLLVVTVERYTTAQYKSWWSDSVEVAQIVGHGSLILSVAGIAGEDVDADWFRRLESDGGVVL